MNDIRGKLFFCSWSGGKDSCLALYHAARNGGIPKVLITMFTEEGKRSRSHRIPYGVVEAQAQALGIPFVVRKTSWDGYEKTFLSAIHKFKEMGIEVGVFGDIDVESHLEWVERVCSSISVRPYEPLWKRDRHDLLDEFLQLGFHAVIIAVKQGILDRSFLGQTLSRELISAMEKAGIDASGEEGEYHTLVIDGPIFSSAICIEMKDRYLHDGYCFLDISSVPHDAGGLPR
ncbi:MAG: diphthine--ammonia ligase [Pseudomonadota bacterium]